MLKQVEEEEKNQLLEEESKQQQDKEIAQEIEELIVIQYMEVDFQQYNQDVGLMLYMEQIISQSPPPLAKGKALDDEEEIAPLDEGLVMDIFSVTFDELQKKILQERNKKFPGDLTHHDFIKEKVIIMDTKKNHEVIVATNIAFVGASKPNIEYLMVENRQMENNLEVTRKQIEQLQEEVQNKTPTQVYLCWMLLIYVNQASISLST